ncbi:MAG: hypothetical protein WC167_03525 [Bacilli bacterium]
MRNLKKQLVKESKTFVPDLKDQIYQSIGYRKMRPKLSIKRSLVYSLMLSIGLILSLLTFLNLQSVSNSYVIIEINPMVELEINNKDKVTDVSSLNVDGFFLLENIDLIDKKIEEALLILLNEAEKQGYLQTEDSKLTVSAINKNDLLETKIASRIKETVEKHRPGIVRSHDEWKEKAAELGISLGKMVLINQVMGADSNLTIEEALTMDHKALMAILKENAQTKVEKFKEQYRKNLKQLKNEYERNQKVLEGKRAIVENHLETLKTILSSLKKPEQFFRLVDRFFPEFYYNPTEVSNLWDLLESIESYYEEYFVFYDEMVNDNLEIKIASYRAKVHENAKNGIDDFNLVLDDAFWLIDLPNKYTKAEKDVLKLINRIHVLINNNYRGASEKISFLYKEYLEKIALVSEDFRQNEFVLNFEQVYRDFLEESDL